MEFKEILEQHRKSNLYLVCEPPAYLLEKEDGTYTKDDYYNVPKGVRVELIEGKFYWLGRPNRFHQQVVARLIQQLLNHIDSKGGKCKVLPEPNLQLDEEGETILIPDVAVVCDETKLTDMGILGAPDLVIEVLSPSTRKRDKGMKLQKYKKAGVREYWIVDVEKQYVTVHLFEKEELLVFGREHFVPVWIFEGELMVDLQKL